MYLVLHCTSQVSKQSTICIHEGCSLRIVRKESSRKFPLTNFPIFGFERWFPWSSWCLNLQQSRYKRPSIAKTYRDDTRGNPYLIYWNSPICSYFLLLMKKQANELVKKVSTLILNLRLSPMTLRFILIRSNFLNQLGRLKSFL